MVRIFLQNGLKELFILFLYGFVANSNLLLFWPTPPEVNGTWLYNATMGFVRWFSFDHQFLFILYFLFLSALLVRVVHQTFLRVEFFESGNYLIAFASILLLAIFNDQIYWQPAFLASFFLLLALRNIFRSYNNQNLSPVFNAAFWIGLAGLFYPPAFVLSAVLFSNLLFLRSFHWRDWTLTFVGLALPIYLIYSYTFLVDQSGTVWSMDLPISLLETDERIWKSLPNWRLLSFALLLAVFAYVVSIIFPNRYNRSTNILKDHFRILLTLVVLGLAIVLIFESQIKSAFVLVLVPISPLLAYCFGAYRNIFKAEIIHLILGAFLIIFQYRVVL